MKSKSKWKNYSLWVSIFSLIGLVLQTYGLFEKLGLTNETYNEIVKAILVVLTGAGIISNPSIGQGFLDAKDNDKI